MGMNTGVMTGSALTDELYLSRLFTGAHNFLMNEPQFIQYNSTTMHNNYTTIPSGK
jgi:hypothetical protein